MTDFSRYVLCAEEEEDKNVGKIIVVGMFILASDSTSVCFPIRTAMNAQNGMVGWWDIESPCTRFSPWSSTATCRKATRGNPGSLGSIHATFCLSLCQPTPELYLEVEDWENLGMPYRAQRLHSTGSQQSAKLSTRPSLHHANCSWEEESKGHSFERWTQPTIQAAIV
jgi:hypothetical protein